MKVIDLSSRDVFAKTVQQLESEIIDSKINFDLIIAIPSGGQEVVELMANLVAKLPVRFMVKQRPSTKYKKKLNLKVILPFLPKFFNNFLRVVESKLLEIKFNRNRLNGGTLTEEVIPVDSNLIKDIQSSHSILIVDDAIDSGQTMASVVCTIRNINQDIQVTTSAINSTFKTPLVKADFLIYEQVLVRYPWANDVKQP